MGLGSLGRVGWPWGGEYGLVTDARALVLLEGLWDGG